MISSFARLARTIKYLRAKQFFYFIKRRFFSLTYVNDNKIYSDSLQDIVLNSPIAIKHYSGDYTFIFLNHKVKFSSEDIDWMGVGQQRLWTYNLHYFDYLRDPDRNVDNKIKLIKDWINNNKQNATPGWEPFTCSLRIVNWIFFSVENQYSDSDFLSSLYTQVNWLEKNDEKHILANHYFENLKALLFSSYFFKGSDADRWFDYASSSIIEEIKEQFLVDGGHYERTPQYHSLMLENLLDIYNLISNNKTARRFSNEKLVKQYITEGLSFLKQIEMPDGTLPMFNDTAQKIAPLYTELREYSEQLNIQFKFENKKIFSYKESGLYGFKSKEFMFIIDCGDVGPSYQPGHTHCDMLSYELFIDGERLIVDTGVAEYEPGELRKYVRSTKAHNTVQINNAEQSEIWGEFRVGRRAKVIDAILGPTDERKMVFKGSYKGFGELAKDIVHTRTCQLELDPDNDFLSLDIEDKVSSKVLAGSKNNIISSYIHLSPKAEVKKIYSNSAIIQLKKQLYELHIKDSECSISQEKCVYCPEFGLTLNSICLVIRKNATMPSCVNYKLTRVR